MKDQMQNNYFLKLRNYVNKVFRLLTVYINLRILNKEENNNLYKNINIIKMIMNNNSQNNKNYLNSKNFSKIIIKKIKRKNRIMKKLKELNILISNNLLTLFHMKVKYNNNNMIMMKTKMIINHNKNLNIMIILNLLNKMKMIYIYKLTQIIKDSLIYMNKKKK